MEESTPMEEIAALTLSELSARLQWGRLSAVAATDGYLENIEARDGRLNAFIGVTADAARTEAAASALRLGKGRLRGPLEGVPLAIKDLLDVAGTPTTSGMVAHAPAAESDAEVVRRLRAAGAVVLGKLNMHEAALGPTNDNPHFGACHNPWQHGFTPGGSSGGAGAAVAAGLCAGALGSDNMGSVRIPAAFCGVAGLKPTHGLLSTRGMAPLSWSTGTVGPLARDVAGIALMMEALAGYDPACQESRQPPGPLDFALAARPSLGRLKVGVPENLIAGQSEPEVERAFREALGVLEGLGAQVVPLQIADIEAARKQCLKIIVAEGAYTMADMLADPAHPASAEVRQFLAYGRDMPAQKLVGALQYRRTLRHRIAETFQTVDALATPTTPLPAFALGGEAPAELAHFLAPASLCGLPALSLPMGFSAAGLPLGLQIMAPPFHDGLTLRIGHAYQRATDWHQRRPALPATG